MKNNNHTQGEWHLKSVNGIKYVQDKNNRYLATVHSLEDGKNNDERREESEANARLIVKAVNNHRKLVEALESAAKSIWAIKTYHAPELKETLTTEYEEISRLLQSIEQ